MISMTKLELEYYYVVSVPSPQLVFIPYTSNVAVRSDSLLEFFCQSGGKNRRTQIDMLVFKKKQEAHRP